MVGYRFLTTHRLLTGSRPDRKRSIRRLRSLERQRDIEAEDLLFVAVLFANWYRQI